MSHEMPAAAASSGAADAHRYLSDPEYITIDQVVDAMKSGTPVVVLDARSERSYEDSDETVTGSIRLSPDTSVADARRLNVRRDAVLPVFCA